MLSKLFHAHCNKNKVFCSNLDIFKKVGKSHYCLNYCIKTAVFQMLLLSKMLIELLADLITIMIVKTVLIIIVVLSELFKKICSNYDRTTMQINSRIIIKC